MLSILVHGARQLGIELDSHQLDLFERYYRLLEAASSRVSLTSVTGYEAVQQRHFLESLALAPALREAGLLAPGRRERVLDLGAGAGLPGLPLKIAAPDLSLTLVEATARKAAFLREVVAELALEGVEMLTGPGRRGGEAGGPARGLRAGAGAGGGPAAYPAGTGAPFSLPRRIAGGA